MAVIILAILLIGLLLIATESVNHINKAAVAMFVGVICWLLYIAHGAEFIINEHPFDFLSYISSHNVTANSVKEFIAGHVFVKYIAQCAGIVLFLLATTSIVEVLHQNGCFDFMNEWLLTRRPRKLMWMLAALTFLLSANLDNLATVVLVLSIVHPLLQNDKLRRIYGTVIVLAANLGGAVTAIGDLTSLKLWTDEHITPSVYFCIMVIPICVALIVTLALLQHNLPQRVEFASTTLPYRGDDTVLNRSQRLLMLFVGIGGLWFIPTFHRITLMPPFVGALCVLAFLWFVNELCNRHLLVSDQMVHRRLPMALQYANLQNLLYFIGIMFMFGALAETGLTDRLANNLCAHGANVYGLGLISTALSALLGNIPILVAGCSIFGETSGQTILSVLDTDGAFWPILSYSTALGGTLLLTGSVTGATLMRIEGVSFGWYFKHVTPKVLAGFFTGFACLIAIAELL